MLGRLSRLRTATTGLSRRFMGGHGHDHGHGHEEQAYFLGLKPGTPSEGFELIYGVTMISCLVVIIGGSYMKDDVSFLTWARREALAREKVVENGGEIEFGKYYQEVKYQHDGVGVAPVLADE